MNILVFEKGQREMVVTADELNQLDQTFDFLNRSENLEENWIIREWNEEENSGYPICFAPGKYRLTRPEHVSITNPALSDLGIVKVE